MLSAFEKVTQGAFTTLKSIAGVQATYRRGSQATHLTVVPGMSSFLLDDGGGPTVKVKVQDFLIDAADMQFDGQAIQPKAGDQIEILRADGLHRFRVASPGQGHPDWRWSDTGRTRLRVHTKFVEVDK